MNTQQQINTYIAEQPEAKRIDMQLLNDLISGIMPNRKLWFVDGKNSDGKVVSNPSIGYGSRNTTYADGKTKEFYQIGLSANTTGTSVYILGIADKTFLSQTFGKDLGKANVTGYCIKFKTVKDINLKVLETAIRCGVKEQ